MSEENTKPLEIHEAQSQLSLGDIPLEQLIKLKRQNLGIIIFGVIFSVMAGVCGIIFLGAALDPARPDGLEGLFIGTSIGFLIYGSLALGSLSRIPAFRIPTIVIFGIMLLGIPIGTVLGIFGLFCYLKAEPLFGPDRFRQADIEKELLARKQVNPNIHKSTGPNQA